MLEDGSVIHVSCHNAVHSVFHPRTVFSVAVPVDGDHGFEGVGTEVGAGGVVPAGPSARSVIAI